MPTKCTLFSVLICVLSVECAHNEKQIPVSLADSTIHSMGIIYSENKEISLITAPCDGKIVSIKASQGQSVNSGRIIAYIENSDILILQKEYLEAKNELEFSSREYARQGDLTVENATSLKRMEIAQREFQVAELKYQSFRKQLKLLGINPDSVNQDNLQTRLSIMSPSKGIITSAPTGKGFFVKKGDPLFEIAGTQTMLLQLEIPETSVWKVQKDQLIRFNTVSDSTLIMDGQIIATATSIDPVKHTAVIIAKPSAEYSRLLPGMTVRATIYLTASQQ